MTTTPINYAEFEGHSPLPWVANGSLGWRMNSYSQPWAVMSGSMPHINIVCGCFGDTPRGVEAAEANARLIAAAPALLARCKELEKALSDIDAETASDKRGPRENLIEIHRLARAALAPNQEPA